MVPGAARHIPVNNPGIVGRSALGGERTRLFKQSGGLRHLTSNGGASNGGASDDGASPNDGGASPSDGGASSGGAIPNDGASAPLRASDVPPRRRW